MGKGTRKIAGEPAFSEETAGLYYLWGRKDPFTSKRETYVVFEPDENTSKLDYYIAHPNHYSINPYYTDWDWNSDHTSRWSSQKTIY
ncbi:MAG: hypothetical protein J6V81_06630, partial [Bacteroidales bacterium]|nr:hypothetical protein [Bacteroidales bacterium]